jgi:HD-like signal output (HDOD) protein
MAIMDSHREEPWTGKVLFVDDEINVLRSIERGFLHSNFEVVTALSAREGLRILDRDDIDIVVTDYRMPWMDGLQFLQCVRERYPRINRVILSGYIEKSVAIESLTRGLASSYILKPWKNDEIEIKLKHILSTRKTLQSWKLLEIINRITNLPTLPNIFQEFMVAVNKERSMAEIAQIIQKDPAVATKVLQIANSAFYGNKKCTSVKQATLTLGLETLQDILLTISVISSMKWKKKQIQNLQEIFTRSFLVNYYLPILYRENPTSQQYKYFPSVGLTYDVGKIILLQYFPDRYRMIESKKIVNGDNDFYKTELSLGFDNSTHQEIGAYFLEFWNLPELFVETALFHHNPEGSAVHYRNIIETTHYIDDLIGYISSAGEKDVIDLSPFFRDFLSEDMVGEVAAEIRIKMDGHFFFFTP